MTRNDLFSGLLRGAAHSSGELLHGIQNEEWREARRVPPPEVPAPQPAQPVIRTVAEVEIDIRHWLKVRDQALGY